MQTGARIGFILLFAPLLLWLGLLIVIPHIDLFLLSLRERIGVGEYRTSLANYIAFFGEPLYLVTFMRTAIMSVLATVLTLLIVPVINLIFFDVLNIWNRLWGVAPPENEAPTETVVSLPS